MDEEVELVVKDKSCPICGEVASDDRVASVVREVRARLLANTGFVNCIQGILCQSCAKMSNIYLKEAGMFLKIKDRHYFIGVQQN